VSRGGRQPESVVPGTFKVQSGQVVDVVSLAEPAALVWPTTEVRESFLAGEREDCLERGVPTDWLDAAAEDFDGYVAGQSGVRIKWQVPSTVFWYVSAEHYLGTLVIRHRLTPDLAEAGGHVGYHVAPAWRRQGHATRMLAAGLGECQRLGLRRVLLTCDIENEASRRVILANGGVPDGQARGEDRFWISL
jgi:predicted acetyltransferase